MLQELRSECMAKKDTKVASDNNQATSYPPVIAVLGHVDHGKTTLLDTMRKTNIAAREHGGITQRIGASSIEIVHEGKKRRITFIDTPGHEAFSKMRSRGAQAADIGLLIISVVDGVMPQTKESLQLLKDAQIPYIVVFTKSDVAQASQEKVKQQVLKEGVILEGLGGDVPYIFVSAKTGSNIKELLDLILLVFDLHLHEKVKGSETGKLRGIVIESRLDEKAGPKATVVIKSGKIAVRDAVACDSIKAKVRMLTNPEGQRVEYATVGDAVEVLGFERVPLVGGIVATESSATHAEPKPTLPIVSMPTSPMVFNVEKPAQDTLSLVLIADTLGSLEAIVNSFPEKVVVVERKTGDISPADIFLAKSTGAIVVGFNSKIKPQILQLARTEKVLVKNYTIIYELLSEINDVLKGKALAMQEEIFGSAKILATFPFEKTKVLGVRVIDGRIAKGDKVRLMQVDNVIGESTITSIRQGKNPTSKVEKGQEAGVIISPLLDFTIGDVLLSHS